VSQRSLVVGLLLLIRSSWAAMDERHPEIGFAPQLSLTSCASSSCRLEPI
jgi:hypothetical protein